MQDIHSIGGGRLFGGGGGDRRLRPHPHQNHQALKCPRCDSLNTKFCYYNNYNLSQPRHFCKNCRRYWTKGGVLRNVPVGGGCRKTKRSSKPKPNSESSAQTQTQTQTEAPAAGERDRKANSHSSSESSSTLTVTNNNNNNNNTSVETVSVHSSSSVSNVLSAMNNNNNNNNNDPGFETAPTTALLDQASSDCGIFSEIGSFTSLITSSNEALPFGFSNLLNNAQQNLEHVQNEQQRQQWQQEQQKLASASSMGGHHELKLHEMASGLLDQTVHDELSALQDRSGNTGGFGSLDWHGSGDHQGLFDLPNAVDHASYWSQSTQWTDQDHPSLYLP
ncbi:hypothetical protein WN944_013992 [Citrus x changshan-huyou]|uniref:Dof zinc finger protein n=1 Tax=Citrus x changshan-huyou TaxID=2935761 RepID=A0AAP0M943_9ROSI